jgi:prepilin peptidase CpaA
MFALAGLKLLMLGGFLVAAVILDVHSRRIPNGLCALMLVTGLVLQTVFAGVDGLLIAIGGLVTGFAVLIPLYLAGRMGAGDVKLMASVGTFLGATGALTAGAATLVVGGIIGGGVVMWNEFRMWGAANDLVGFRGSVPDMLWQLEFPYAAAIAVGTAAALAIDSPLHLLSL